MEGSFDNLDIFSVFCSNEKVLNYFDEFHNLLQEPNYFVMSNDLSKFLKCLIVYSQNDNEIEKCVKLESTLISIFYILSQKFTNTSDILYKESDKLRISLLFETISRLIKIIVCTFGKNICIKHMFSYLKDCFDKYLHYREDGSNMDQSVRDKLQYVVKFFINILQSFNHNDSTYCIPNQEILLILKSFPLSNKYEVNLFTNYLLPNLYSISDNSLKKSILELLWDYVVVNFKGHSSLCEEPHFYSVLCSFSDYLSKEQVEVTNFKIIDDFLWKIIQKGLTSNNAFNRKQAIYVFKIFLLILKTKDDVCSPVHKKSALFSFDSPKDLLLWNELVVLFEVLEEKQIHVIRPVLPKFSRILQHSSKYSSNEESQFIHPSWITCLIQRMISHESKFLVKEGLSIAMNIDFSVCQIHLLDSENFIQILIRGFNDQNMYCRMRENDSSSLFLTSDKLIGFLKKYIEAFETELQKINFLRYVLKLMASESWCGVAVMHFTFALSNLKSLPAWNMDDLIYIRKVQSLLKSHEPILRSAVERWIVKCCIIFTDWNSLCLEDIAELLFIFKNLKRKSGVWDIVVKKLKELFSNKFHDNLFVNEVEKYCLNCIKRVLSGDQNLSRHHLQKMTRMIILLVDSSVISSSLQEKALNVSHLLQPLTSVLSDAPRRPYMSQELFLNALQFCTLLIDTSQGCFKNTKDNLTCVIIKSLNCSSEFVEFLCQKSFMELKNSIDIINFQILFHALCILSSSTYTNELFINILPNFTMRYNNVPGNYLSKKVLIVLFYSISANQLSETKSKNLVSNIFSVLSSSLLSKIIEEDIVSSLSKLVFINDSEREAWLEIATSSICNFWNVTGLVIDHLSEHDLQILIPALVPSVQTIFSGGSKATYASTINCIQAVLAKLGIESITIIQDLLDSAWKACLELQGSDAFRSAAKTFTKAIFQSYMFKEEYFDILYKYLDCFSSLSENTLGIFYFVVKEFCGAFALKSLFKKKFNYIPLLTNALTYGPIHHKSQKILEDTVAYIGEKDNCFANEFKSYDKPLVFVRIAAITYLMKHLYEGDFESEVIALKLVNNLLDLDDSTRASKSSKFSNSYCHRVRNRIWQMILLLQPNIITREENGKILKRILELLEVDNQQPSVRYLQEWFVLKLLFEHTRYIEDFISVLENCAEKRPGFITSVLSILNHLIMHNSMVSKHHASKCFPALINCCMSQNFAVRLYGRLAIEKLISFCEDKKFTDLTEKYDFLSSILSFPQPESVLLEKGNVYKNLLKLQEDFYFAHFHPMRHFTLETIFYELPRLTSVASEEWIKPGHFQWRDHEDHLHSDSSDFLIPVFNSDDCLKNCITSSWSDKDVEESVITKNDIFDYNFQKKIIPVRLENDDCDIDLLTGKKPKENGLIVIASLIDRIPNLGGLCRTCEVFGVNELIIGSLKYIEDKQFQNLAVSADKWVSIKEVKPYHLKEYLLSLKEEGYTLIGAEQTDESYKLTDYTFPKKSALLLGHEKEGMPINLIQLLDACVEIPQQGIIRSLNVHVSGAIFIWEYARQQIKQPV